MTQIKPYQVLILSVLILGTACKKNLPATVNLSSSPKGAIQLTSNSGRLIAFDDNDGTGLSNLLSYDVGSGAVSLNHVSGGSVTTLWNTTGLTLDNGTTIGLTGYSVTDPYNEVGGVHIISYDIAGTGHQDHLLVYIPGAGKAYVLAMTGTPGLWHQVWPVSPTTGIAGYDLASQYDKIIAFELNGTARTALIAYRPGSGTCWVIQNQGTATSPNFVGVVKGSSGIGGFDLKGTSDQLVAVDDNPGSGSSDLIAYRPGPGLGYVWYMTHAANSTSFTATYTSHSGLPNFPCNHLGDRIIAYDLNGSGWQNYLLCYSPGNAAATVVDAVSGAVASGSPLTSTSNFNYPMSSEPYSHNYVGDKLLGFEGNGGSWGYSTIIGYQNGTSFDQIYDLALHGVNGNGTYSFTQVY